MKINQEQFLKIKKEAEKFYKEVESVYCPFLKRKINFNVKGLDHIKIKEWNKGRLMQDQYLRLKFLHLAPEILKLSGTLQEYQEGKSFERVNINSRWENHLKDVNYYGFVAIINEVKLKIIVKEIDGGQPYFWSIIPSWKVKKDKNNNKTKKVFHKGKLETD